MYVENIKKQQHRHFMMRYIEEKLLFFPYTHQTHTGITRKKYLRNGITLVHASSIFFFCLYLFIYVFSVNGVLLNENKFIQYQMFTLIQTFKGIT